jgi:N-acyl-D-amino-acid deacylase
MQLPGATVAVSRDGQILYERAFGWADVDQQTPMQTTSEMRIASISKPLTAVTILLLEADGLLTLDSPVLPLLARHSAGFPTSQALAADPRWADVQVRHLLQHTAGFNRDKSKDTMFELATIAASLSLDRSPNVNDIVRYQLGQPLDNAPGSEFHYSNVGYCLLGRVIEAVTETSYEAVVRQRILIPCGMQQTRLGKTRLEQRGPMEVTYVTRNRRRVPLVFDLLQQPRSETRLVETPWGQWDLEVMDAHGGWVSTAADLVRFAEAVSVSQRGLLQEKSFSLMLQKPALPDKAEAQVWYGLGWNVRALAEVNKSNFWHTGLLSGTSSLLVRRWDDCCWAVLFNCDRTDTNKPCADVIDGPMHRAVDQSLQLLQSKQ